VDEWVCPFVMSQQWVALSMSFHTKAAFPSALARSCVGSKRQGRSAIAPPSSCPPACRQRWADPPWAGPGLNPRKPRPSAARPRLVRSDRSVSVRTWRVWRGLPRRAGRTRNVPARICATHALFLSHARGPRVHYLPRPGLV